MSVPNPQHRRIARGLTLVELIIGTAIMGMIMLALATFTTAVAAGWKHSNDAHRVSDVGRRVGEQLQSTISNMLAVVYSKQGGQTTNTDAYLFYWANDAYSGAADAKAQFGEMGLLEYRASTKSIYLYEPKSQSAMTSGQQTIAAVSNWGVATSQSDMDTIVGYYKVSGVATAAKQLAGPDSGGKGTSVDATALELFAPTNAKPMVMYDMVMTDPLAKAAGDVNASQRTFGTAILRGPKKPTNVN